MLVFSLVFFYSSVFQRVFFALQTEILLLKISGILELYVLGSCLPDIVLKYVNQCSKPELTVLTAADPDNLSVLSAGYSVLCDFFPLHGLMNYIQFLSKELNFQVGFHVDFLKYLVLNLFSNTAFSDCNLFGWLCWGRKHLLCSGVLQVGLRLPSGFRKMLMKNGISLDNGWWERRRLWNLSTWICFLLELTRIILFMANRKSRWCY